MKNITIALSLIFSAFFTSVNAQAPSKKSDKKILFVITSHDKLGNTGEKTGFWSEEFAAPYYELTDQGVEVTIASPKGGQPPIDPRSTNPSFATEDTKRFDKDAALLKKLSQTLKLSNVKQSDYDAVFYPGGHGPLWDLAEDKDSQALITSFYTHNKPVAFVCHAPGVLKDVKVNGQYLVKGKNVTGFANTEEEAVGLTKIVPFLLEDVLQQRGASYSKLGDWASYVVEDGLLITGQNPSSSKLVAKKLLTKLNK